MKAITILLLGCLFFAFNVFAEDKTYDIVLVDDVRSITLEVSTVEIQEQRCALDITSLNLNKVKNKDINAVIVVTTAINRNRCEEIKGSHYFRLDFNKGSNFPSLPSGNYSLIIDGQFYGIFTIKPGRGFEVGNG